MNKPSNAVFLGALIVAALFVTACSLFGLDVFNPSATPAPIGKTSPPANTTPMPGRVSINYTAADVDQAEARWKSKEVDTYQIEVWYGPVTPPPPVYVVQVWKGKVVFAAADYRMDGVHDASQKPLATDAREVQAVTVPGLFAQARELLKRVQTGPTPVFDIEITVVFDEEWGFPKGIDWFARCPDCWTLTRVQKFVPFDSASPPPTPTPRE